MCSQASTTFEDAFDVLVRKAWERSQMFMLTLTLWVGSTTQ